VPDVNDNGAVVFAGERKRYNVPAAMSARPENEGESETQLQARDRRARSLEAKKFDNRIWTATEHQQDITDFMVTHR
jgi:hypothetical protein